MGICAHDGFHTGSARYEAAARTMHYVVVCDGCGKVIRDLTTERYEPQPRFEAQGGAADAVALSS
jgi:Fe2+ or Zn2+ uptake regulation protein